MKYTKTDKYVLSFFLKSIDLVTQQQTFIGHQLFNAHLVPIMSCLFEDAILSFLPLLYFFVFLWYCIFSISNLNVIDRSEPLDLCCGVCLIEGYAEF